MGCTQSTLASVAVAVDSLEDFEQPYEGAAHPLNEGSRIAHLKGLGVLDTEPEQNFDSFTKLCCTIFKVPIALVSLVDTDRQWFKSVQGVDAKETDRTSSFCAWTLLPAYPEALVVEDTELDARFKGNALVKGFPFIRFYAGCPLIASNGLRLGSLCIIDRAPRLFDAESCALLANIAEMVVREIEKDHAADLRADESKKPAARRRSIGPADARQPNAAPGADAPLLRDLECLNDAVMVVNTAAAGEWAVAYANDACQRLLGGAQCAGGASFWSVFKVLDARGRAGGGGAAAVQGAYVKAVQERRNFEVRVAYTRHGGEGEPQEPGAQQGGGGGGGGSGGGSGQLMAGVVQFRFAPGTGVDANMPLIGIPNFLPSSKAPPSYYFATLREVGPAPRSAGGVGGGAAAAGAAAAGAGAVHTSAASVGSSLGGDAPPRTGSSTIGSSGVAGSGTYFSMLPNNEVFEDIKLGPLLGKGSFGRVYRATWNASSVAVKIIEFVEDVPAEPPQPELGGANGAQQPPPPPGGGGAAGGGGGSGGGEQQPRALLEGLLQEHVNHPNIVRTYKFFVRETPTLDDGGGDSGGDCDGDPDSFHEPSFLKGGGKPDLCNMPSKKRHMETWLVLEFCNRGCIADAIEKGWFRARRAASGPHARAVLATAREVAAAMAYLHAAGILHGDLTGGNVLLTAPALAGAKEDPRGFVAKVSDFGLSRSIVDDDFISTRTYGTVTHMPMEVLMEGKISKAADVYSFGVLLWEMFQGHRPYLGLTHSQVLHAVTSGRTLAPPAAAPVEAQALLSACLSPRPEARPKFSEVVETLERLEAAHEW